MRGSGHRSGCNPRPLRLPKQRSDKERSRVAPRDWSSAAGEYKAASVAVKRSRGGGGQISSSPFHTNLKHPANAEWIANDALLRNFVAKSARCGKCVAAKWGASEFRNTATAKLLCCRSLRRGANPGRGRSGDPRRRILRLHTWQSRASWPHRPQAPRGPGRDFSPLRSRVR